MQINGYEFVVGADPECFVVNDKGDLISAHGLIPGTKDNPFPVNNRGFVQVDGMALEYNVPPASCKTHFIQNVVDTQNQLKALLPAGYHLSRDSVAHFGAKTIKAQPLEARILGCEPDFNAYTGEVNPTPNAETPFRTASGHIHIGWTKGVDPMDENHFAACRRLVKALDDDLGLFMNTIDPDPTRRELYGKAGAFRPKHYGVEYRTPSCAWTFNRNVIDYVFVSVERAIRNSFNRYVTVGNRQNCINRGDKLEEYRKDELYHIFNIPRYILNGEQKGV